ncbi:hypothetical protein BDV93DRAFT_525065 [Ceratobasidium sp. AG-I]|nr:hypothetical protein BDV93DRAFT_525065 [Ceratobasidium sp. AG-I]
MFQHQQQQKQQHQQPPQQQFTRPTNPVGRPLSGTHQVAVAGEPERLALPFPGDLPCSGCEVIM